MKSARGMTLVEVLAVVVILGLLAGTFAMTYSGVFGKSKTELAKTGIGLVVGKLEIYRMEHNEWPGPEVGLAALSDGYASPTAPYYVGPDRLLDPWGRRYLLVIPGPDGHPYEVLSLGADGQPGGAGENADVSSLNMRPGEERR